LEKSQNICFLTGISRGGLYPYFFIYKENMYIVQGRRPKKKNEGITKGNSKNLDFLLHPRFNPKGNRM
jgi:hypothetical protein